MEDESFEDEEIAAFMNDLYVSIKVDREERPDVDAIYMAAVQALTGSGGWPMSVWLTPDREPFFGGTYFPPRDGARGASHGFMTILRDIHATYNEDPAARRARGGRAGQRRAVAHRGRRSAPASGSRAPRRGGRSARRVDCLQAPVRRARRRPARARPSSRRTSRSVCCCAQHARTGDGDALRMAALTLEKMAAGGMCDQLAGGFHRYSTDARWLVPHFEKMLYDNGCWPSPTPRPCR